MKGFQTAVGEPAVEGGRDGADGVLKEGESCGQLGGIEGADAHYDVGVTVDVFGYRVDYNVGPMI